MAVNNLYFFPFHAFLPISLVKILSPILIGSNGIPPPTPKPITEPIEMAYSDWLFLCLDVWLFGSPYGQVGVGRVL